MDLHRFLAAFTADRLVQAAAAAQADDPEVAPTAGFDRVVAALDQAERVRVAGVAGAIVRADLDGLLGRAWLFGIVTALERRLRDDLAAQGAWTTLLSPERLQRARDLKAERARRGQAVGTMACLQFGDLGQMAVRTSWWQELLGLGSNRAAKELAKRLELLRNDLAHGQDVVGTHWETVVIIAGNLETLEQAGGSAP
jgi:hypothetical protein